MARTVEAIEIKIEIGVAIGIDRTWRCDGPVGAIRVRWHGLQPTETVLHFELVPPHRS